MARRSYAKLTDHDISGLRYFKAIRHLLKRLHPDATQRDRARKRRLFYDGYAALLLLYFFNPTLTSLRALAQAADLAKVRKRLGVGHVSHSTLSEAACVFDTNLLRRITVELASQLWQRLSKSDDKRLAELIAVDGSLLPALPRMTWAVWQDSNHRAAKAHVAFSVLGGFPVDATITAGSDPERPQWRAMVHPGGFYVVDRGYSDYSLFQDLDALPCRFIARLQENAVFEVLEELAITTEAERAGVVRDVTLRRLGTEKHNALLNRPMRIVIVERPSSRPGVPRQRWILATNDLELSADLVALGYKHRWAIELFFRWLKCILSCRHLFHETPSGVEMQVYAALIATLLISARTGLRPSKRTYEMFCHYLSGWASIDELEAHLNARRRKEAPS